MVAETSPEQAHDFADDELDPEVETKLDEAVAAEQVPAPVVKKESAPKPEQADQKTPDDFDMQPNSNSEEDIDLDDEREFGTTAVKRGWPRRYKLSIMEYQNGKVLRDTTSEADIATWKELQKKFSGSLSHLESGSPQQLLLIDTYRQQLADATTLSENLLALGERQEKLESELASLETEQRGFREKLDNDPDMTIEEKTKSYAADEVQYRQQRIGALEDEITRLNDERGRLDDNHEINEGRLNFFKLQAELDGYKRMRDLEKQPQPAERMSEPDFDNHKPTPKKKSWLGRIRGWFGV